MSLEGKIRRAATAAALDATNTERARCQDVLRMIIKQLEADFEAKLLVEAQRQLAKVKLDIAKGIAALAINAIQSGVRPSDGTSPPEKGPILSVE